MPWDEPTHVPVRNNDVLEGKWRIERKLGEGGMGTVYLAHDIQLDRKVAVKILASALVNDAELVTRFEREAKVTAGLEHPHIVPVYAVGRHERRPFMVMKALEGRTLGILLREKGALQPEELLGLFRQLASGLDFIHSKGFVHRDIKAGNIFVGSDGHGTILDFGILRPSRNAEALTRTGMVMGTPQYMSPEQARGVRDIDHRSDLYALAVLLFECITGGLPFDADNDLSIIQMQAHSPPPDACERAPWVPRPVADVLARALAKDPAERYPSASELVAALEQAYAGVGPLPAGMELQDTGAPLESAPLARPSGPKPGLLVRPSGEKPRPVPGPVTGAGQRQPASEPSTSEIAAAIRRRRGPLYAAAGVIALLACAAGLYTLTRGAPEVPAEVESASGDAGATLLSESPVVDGGEEPVAVAPPREVAAPVAPTMADGEPDASVPPGSAPEPAAAPEGPGLASPAPESSETPSASSRKTLARGLGRLNVITTRRGEPYWASVLVNGKKMGRTPALLELKAGTHRVRIERVGFKPVEKRIKIVSGRSTVLRIELVR